MAAPAALTIPTAAAAMASLDDLLTTAGAATPIKDYITARGISATPTLALIAEDAAAFTDKIVQPFLSGVTLQGSLHKAAAGDEDVSKAILVHLFTEARRQWQAATANPPAPPPGTTPATAPPAATSQTTAAAPEEKPPKTFSQWAAQVRAYEEKTIDGVKRTFPAEKLLGAEEVLARLWHEHTRSKDYKPLGIGEIVSRRTWTSGGDLNTMASSRSSSSGGAKVLKLVDDKLVAEDSDEWAPKGIMLTLDGIEAAKWAWILCGYDEERRVERFTDWFGERARSKQASIPAVHSFWADAMWKLCADMRRGISFGEATRTIMLDTATWNEHIMAHAAATAAKKPQPVPGAAPSAPRTDSAADQGDQPVKGKGGRRWRPRRPAPPERPPKGPGRGGQQQLQQQQQQHHPKGGGGNKGRDEAWDWGNQGNRGGGQQWNQGGGGGKRQYWDDQGADAWKGQGGGDWKRRR